VWRACLVAALVVSSLAAAANPKATALARTAEQRYREGKLEQAIEALTQAYDLEPNSQFLFNLARAQEVAGHTAIALETYRRYVVLPADETDHELVARAKATITGRTSVAEPATTATVQTSKSPGLSSKPTKEPPASSTSSRGSARAEGGEPAALSLSSGPSPKVPGLIVAGVAVATVGVGVTFGLLSSGSRATFRTATSYQVKRAAEITTRQQALIADLCIGAGIAAAVTAVILLARSDGPATVALAPLRDGALLALGLRF